MRLNPTGLLICCFVAISLVTTPVLAGAKITIVNNDGPGEGFNDPAAVEPVGGNPGTTVGQQRLIAFQHAAKLWSDVLNSPVEIFIRAAFDSLSCTATTGTLGSAGARKIFSDFRNAPQPGVWYPVALANKLAGVDLSPGAPGSDGDDINARFNSDVGTPGCLSASGWYYGLDHNEGDKVDLVAVLLHEFGHGLGFQTFTDKQTGEFTQGLPDIYALQLFDNEVGLTWAQMSPTQRSNSAINDQDLVWIGPSATAGAPSFLGGSPVLEVSTPPNVAGDYIVGTAAFGPSLTVAGVTGTLVQATDASDDGTATNGCTALTNAAQIAGRVALIDRGDCTFVVKTQNAQTAGAIGVVIINNVAGPPPQMGGVDDTITIPVVSVTDTDGAKLVPQLGNGVQVTIRMNPDLLGGADKNGRVKMYAPDPFETGSSVSHWDVTATPNLLMEPSINHDLTGVDLTENAFDDLGWFGPPRLSATMSAGLATDRDFDNRIDPGDTVRYTVKILSDGDVDADDVRFDDAVDTNTSIVDGSAKTTHGTASATSTSIRVDAGTIERNTTATITFDVVVKLETSPSVPFVANQGSVTSTNAPQVTTDDPSTTTPADTTRITLSHTPIRATKTAALVEDKDDDGAVSPGETLRYTITVANLGGSAAVGVALEDTVDANTTIVPGSVTTTRGTITAGNQGGDLTVRVTIGDLASSDTATVIFDATVKAGVAETVNAISNQAKVTSATAPDALSDDPATSAVEDPTVSYFAGQRRRAVRR